MTDYPLIDEYVQAAQQRGDTFSQPPYGMSALRGRAQAVARRVLIERHRDEYRALLRQAEDELLRAFPGTPGADRSAMAKREKARRRFVPRASS